MLKSHVIEVSGEFAGAAVRDALTARDAGGFRFVAVDLRVGALHGSVWPTLPDLQRVVRQLFTTGRTPPRARL